MKIKHGAGAHFAMLHILVACLFLAHAPSSIAATTFGNLKTPQQFRADAARYDESVKAITSIATARIATLPELNAATTLLQKHSLSLTLGASRLVALGYDDRRFATAIAANLANERLAADFAQRLATDHRIVLGLDGATELRTRMAALLQANAAALQRAMDNLQAATLRITGKSLGVRPKFFAPPQSTLWNPASTTLLAAIAFTFPSIAANAPVLNQPVTGSTSTNPLVPTQVSISAFQAAMARHTAQAGIMQTFESLQLQQQIFDGVRETATDALQGAVDACVERMRVVFEQCLAAIPESAPADYESARSACELAFAADRAMCKLVPSYGTTNSSLFQFYNSIGAGS